MDSSIYCFVVDQVCWDAEHKKGEKTRLLILAKSVSEAAELAEDDELHQIINMQNIGAITMGSCNKHIATPDEAVKRWLSLMPEEKRGRVMEICNTNIQGDPV
jgi:hypothetical protein